MKLCRLIAWSVGWVLGFAVLSANAEIPVKPGSGDFFKDCPECPEMVVAPSGTFIMGSPEDEVDRLDYEGPEHAVTFSKPFAVGRFAVTFAEWDACVADGGCGGYRPNDRGWGRGNRPAVNVNWDDAKAYVQWLSKKTGKYYRLLSEAEREYVARAGTATTFWWGSSITSENANYDGTYVYAGGGERGVYRRKTMPVDSFKPNPWGLYHVHGNVWEWAEDCRHSTYDGAPADGSSWTSGDCTAHVLRGGSWADDPVDLRAANRINNYPTDRNNKYGFRVARAVTP